MGELDASPGVIVFTVLGVVAGVHAYVCELRLSRRARQLHDWVLRAHPGAWERLSRLLRLIPSHRARLAALRRQRLVVDPEFETRYAAIGHLVGTQLVSIGVAAFSVAAVLVGTRFLGWRW